MHLKSIFGIIALFSGLFLPISAQAGIEGSLKGTITDGIGAPLSNAKVEVRSSSGERKQAISSESGTYFFPTLQMGEYQIVVEGIGHEPFKGMSRVSSGANVYNISLSKEMVVEVKARRHLTRRTNATSATDIDQEEIKKLPQGMEVSLPKLLASTTPGIVQGPFGQMFFRGNHANIQYQIDGVQLPDSPSNTFGQTLSPRNIDHMEVITGGIPAEYGQRLSAVVNMVTKTGPEKPGGEVELNYGSYNTYSPHLLYGGSNESGDLHYFLSLNYNQTDRGLDTPQPVSETDQTQGGKESVHNRASGNSEFAKIDYLAGDHDKFTFLASHSQNDFQYPNYPSSFSPTSRFFQTGFQDSFGNRNADAPTYNYVPSNTDSGQSERNAFVQGIWKHSFSDTGRLMLAPYYKFSHIVVRNDPQNDLAATTLGIAGAEPSSFAQDRNINNVGLKADYHFRPSADHFIKTGFQIQASRADGWMTIQQDLNQAPFRDDSPTTGYFEGMYFQDNVTLSKYFVLNAGLRFDATQFSYGGGIDSTEYALQPRVGLNYLLSDSTKFHIFYGKLFQPAQVESLRIQKDAGTLTALRPYDLKPERNDYYEFGVAHQFLETQVASFNLYYKTGENIIDDHQLLNTSIAQPYNFARGYAYGAEVSLRGQLDEDWSHFLNYSYGNAEGLESSGGIGITTGNTSYQVLDHVQLHTANAGLTYTKNGFWWTTQGLFGSGLRTGPNNSISLPSHLTADTTIGYQFGPHAGLLSNFRFSGDVLNVFDNVYPITIANGFNGSHYAAGRQYFVRIARTF